jgi:hypothetical protein
MSVITTAPAAARPAALVGTATIPAQTRRSITRTPVAREVPAANGEPAAVPDHQTPLLRVEHGHASPEEVAAVTAVLLARAAATRAAADVEALSARRAPARWRGPSFAGPRAWTADARDLLAG